MSLPDNRMRFPAPLIDFVNDVGVTGQDHDNYPDAGQQPRYDWMRMTLISLLSLQSSYSQPTQYRIGTPWFDLNTNTLKIYNGTDFVPIAEVISTGLVDGSSSAVSLADWLTSADSILSQLTHKITFSGSASQDTAIIPIPESIRSYIADTARPIVYADGILIDPRNCKFNEGCISQIELLNGVELQQGQRFTVFIDSFGVFYTDDVIA